TSWLCIVGAAPFAACGFFKYHGMTAEQFAWAWIKSEILYPKRLVFKTENLYYTLMAERIENTSKQKHKKQEIIQHD
ncbi:MAG: PrgI family protein, partial [Oscillospiraceae bacterium]